MFGHERNPVVERHTGGQHVQGRSVGDIFVAKALFASPAKRKPPGDLPFGSRDKDRRTAADPGTVYLRGFETELVVKGFVLKVGPRPDTDAFLEVDFIVFMKRFGGQCKPAKWRKGGARPYLSHTRSGRRTTRIVKIPVRIPEVDFVIQPFPYFSAHAYLPCPAVRCTHDGGGGFEQFFRGTGDFGGKHEIFSGAPLGVQSGQPEIRVGPFFADDRSTHVKGLVGFEPCASAADSLFFQRASGFVGDKNDDRIFVRCKKRDRAFEP